MDIFFVQIFNSEITNKREREIAISKNLKSILAGRSVTRCPGPCLSN